MAVAGDERDAPSVHVPNVGVSHLMFGTLLGMVATKMVLAWTERETVVGMCRLRELSEVEVPRLSHHDTATSHLLTEVTALGSIAYQDSTNKLINLLFSCPTIAHANTKKQTKVTVYYNLLILIILYK